MGQEESAGGALAAETIRAWQRAEEPAVRAVFDLYYPRAARLAALSGLTLHEAQDCAQEAVTQAFSLWFHRIATRRILDALGQRRRGHEVALDAASGLVEDWQRRAAPQPDEQVILAERRQALWESIQTLAPRYRVALALRYYGEFPLRDIAPMLDMREGTLRVTLHRALAQLRAQDTQQTTTPAQGEPPNQRSADCAPLLANPETTGGHLI